MAEPNREIGDLLLSFLKFYGKEFDPRTMGISILNGG
jgi:DNA polymerase sigma